MSCNCNCNPCTNCPPNSADAETLPSTIDNFVRQFFGEITKTEVNGVVSWVLPCNLDIGLENNPRGAAEGLACYFLRLFDEGLLGLTGPAGDIGAAGANGYNAYAVSTSAFNIPTVGDPGIQFTIIPTPIISVGQNIFIPGAGWFLVTNVFENATVFATLIALIDSPSAVITPGSIVLPTGVRGLTVVGPQGIQGLKGDRGPIGLDGTPGILGLQGPQGAPGVSSTSTNGLIVGGEADFALAATYGKVDFGTDDPDIVLPGAGTYLVWANFTLKHDTSDTLDRVSVKLHNVTDAVDLDRTLRDWRLTNYTSVGAHLQTIVTFTETKTIAVYASNEDRVTAIRVVIPFSEYQCGYIKLAPV